jgi:putative membrane protein
MARLRPGERKFILAAIAEAERRTTAELAVAVAHSVDHYAEFRFLLPALLAIAADPLLLALGWVTSLLWAAALPAVIFVVGSALLLPSAVVVRLVPRAVRHARARRLARALFVELGLASPRERTGMLLFVALAERQVEILAGPGVSERVESTRWQAIVTRLTEAARSGRLAEGLAEAVRECGAVLAEALPAAAQNPDEVPNRLIEL